MSNKQLLVIADDFSGACEMAGIARRYDLRTEIQLDFNPDARTPVIIFDSNTRGLTAEQATERMHHFADQVIYSEKDFSLFKKIDSVFRGHIMREAEVLHHRFQKKQTFLLPANPSKERLIVNGRYLINSIPIDQTDFRKDPDFPRLSARIPDLLDKWERNRHLSVTGMPDETGVFTADIPTLAVLDQWILPRKERLYCGGADAFEFFLCKWIPTEIRSFGFTGAFELTADLILFVNGSTHREVNEKGLSGWPKVARQTMPAALVGGHDSYSANAEFQTWLEVLHESWDRERRLFLSAPPEIMTLPPTPDRIVSLLATTVEMLLQERQEERVHILATGGATASAIIQLLTSRRFEVVEEWAPGVVTVSNEEGRFLTTKPGSYPWPEMTFRTNE